jgi:hypothetical protein
LKSECFDVLATKKKSLACMYVEQLIKKKEECMISGFLEERGIFLLLVGCPLLFSHSFYILGNRNLYYTKSSSLK